MAYSIGASQTVIIHAHTTHCHMQEAISKYLLDKGMKVVGTMRSDRAGILNDMKETKSRESPSTPYAYNTDIKSVTVCSGHVTYAFESESTLYSCLNVKELLARSMREMLT